MAARPIADNPDYTLCRDQGNPPDRAAIKELVYVSLDAAEPL